MTGAWTRVGKRLFGPRSHRMSAGQTTAPIASIVRDPAANACSELPQSERASAIVSSNVIVEPGRLLPLPRFLSEHHHELAFEVTFELVLCFEVRIHHNAGVAVELGDGAAEPGGAVGGRWIGREGNARQCSGDVSGVRPCLGECQLEHLRKGGAGLATLPQAERRESKSLQRLHLVVLVCAAAELPSARPRRRHGRTRSRARCRLSRAEVGEADGLEARQPAPASLVNESLEDRSCLLGAVDAREDAGEVADRLDARRVLERSLPPQRLVGRAEPPPRCRPDESA